jgi:hypothetical protein
MCLLELDRFSEADADLDSIAERYAGSPARIEAPQSILVIVEHLLPHPGERARVRELLALARVGVDRTGDMRLRAILGELELEFARGD